MLIDELMNLWYLLPLYVANASLVVMWYFETKGKWKLRSKGLWKWDRELSKKLFGEHKTLYGLILVLAASTLVTAAMGKSIEVGLVLGAGMMAGILLNSFIKRRSGLKSGESMPVLDQIDFVVGAAVAYNLVFGLYLVNLPIALAVTLFVHPLSSIAGNLIGVKEKPF